MELDQLKTKQFSLKKITLSDLYINVEQIEAAAIKKLLNSLLMSLNQSVKYITKSLLN